MSVLCKVFVAYLALLVVTPLGQCQALELVSPPQNTQVHPGEVISIQVAPSPGEEIGVVYFDGLFGEKIYNQPYIYQHKIGPQDVGNILIDIFSLKPENSGPFKSADDYYSSSVELHLISTLPASVMLEKITIEPSPIYITMLPVNDPDANDWATERLRISGIYSDGEEREISASVLGTTYTSSDKNIATVDSEGTVVAQKVGRARITVRNAGKEASADVIIVAKR